MTLNINHVSIDWECFKAMLQIFKKKKKRINILPVADKLSLKEQFVFD